MMDSMIKEKGITFKELEDNMFRSIMEQGQKAMRGFLEEYDKYLADTRDKSYYRDKGTRKTTIKTRFGEITYWRHVYRVVRDDGKVEHVFLLDEVLELDQIGLISAGLAEQMVKGITENSYRECARSISELTGQSISAMGVWKVVQKLGERVCEEEEALTEAYKRGEINGEKKAPVLFEEADGVYLNLQGKDRKHTQKGKAEMKVALAYRGWKKESEGRYALDGKVATAGFADAEKFRERQEAAIAEVYDLDQTELRILNADGGSWTKTASLGADYFQLDQFHRNKAIKEKIHDKEAASSIYDYFRKKDLDGLFDYLETYQNSLSDDDDIQDVADLIEYFDHNRDGLIPYLERDIDLPENKIEGLEYRAMGTMENHIWSIIARRMKHNHTSWSIRGGNHLAKLLAKKCSGRLEEVTEKFKKELFEEQAAAELIGEIIHPGSVPKFTGKGYEYPDRGHFPALSYKLQGNNKQLFGVVDV